MSHKKLLSFITTLFLGWSFIIFLTTYLGFSIFPSIQRPENIYINPPSYNLYWNRWANWDGAHFLSIAKSGYQYYEVVFFPLYPLLIKLLSYFNISFLFSGLLISFISIILAIYFFYKLILLDYENDFAQRALFLFLIFPTSFYFLAAYSESLFFLLTIASFYFARTNNFFYAFTLAGLSSVTRVFGIFTIISILAEFIYQNRKNIVLQKIFLSRQFRFIIYLIITDIFFFLFSGNNQVFIYISYFLFFFTSLFFIVFITFLYLVNPFFKKFLVEDGWKTILSIIPLIIYCIYLLKTQGSAFAFVYYEANWGRQLSFPWQTITTNLNLLSSNVYSALELFFSIFFIVGLAFSVLKLRLSYTIFFGLSLLLPLLTGTLLSIHRFGLLFFPFFLLIAQLKNKALLYIWIIFSTILLGIFSVMFINSYWVA